MYSIKEMYANINVKNGEPASLVADDVYKIIMDVSVGATSASVGQTHAMQLTVVSDSSNGTDKPVWWHMIPTESSWT